MHVTLKISMDYTTREDYLAQQVALVEIERDAQLVGVLYSINVHEI